MRLNSAGILTESPIVRAVRRVEGLGTCKRIDEHGISPDGDGRRLTSATVT